MMESIKKLREIADKLDNAAARMSEHGFSPIAIKASLLCDEIEAEIAERFMELPEGWTAEQASEVIGLWPRWDDGSPCMFGDEFTCYPKYDSKKEYKVLDRLVIFGPNLVWNRGRDDESPHDGGYYEWNFMRPGGDGCEEYRPTKRKPRTVEDVLCDMIHEYACTDMTTEQTAAKYADEIRDLMGGDGR